MRDNNCLSCTELEIFNGKQNYSELFCSLGNTWPSKEEVLLFSFLFYCMLLTLFLFLFLLLNLLPILPFPSSISCSPSTPPSVSPSPFAVPWSSYLSCFSSCFFCFSFLFYLLLFSSFICLTGYKAGAATAEYLQGLPIFLPCGW
jgi:hypothetical protein